MVNGTVHCLFDTDIEKGVIHAVAINSTSITFAKILTTGDGIFN